MTQATMTGTADTNTTAAPTSTTADTTASTAEKLYGGAKGSETQDQTADKSAQSGAAPTAPDDAAKAPTDAKAETQVNYEFKAPEGKTFDPEVIAEYSKVAKELNLSQESAQRVLDAMGPKLAERQMAQIEALRNGWADSSKADKEFGGERLSENLSVAKKALDAFGTNELRALLNETGIGNHPEVIRFMFRAGKAISEDKFVSGSKNDAKPNGPRSFNDLAEALYSPNT